MRIVGWVVMLVVSIIGEARAQAPTRPGRSHVGLEDFDRMVQAFPHTSAEENECGRHLEMTRAIIRMGQEPVLPERDVELMKECILDARGKRAQLEAVQAAINARNEAERTARAERQAATAEREERIAKSAKALADTQKAAQWILSALICGEMAARAETMSSIAKERRYSKIGGVINLSRMSELQDDVASHDDSIRSARAALKGRKLPGLPCKDKTVRLFAACLADDPRPACTGEEAAAIRQASELILGE